MRTGSIVSSAFLALIVVTGVIVGVTELGGVSWPASMTGLGAGILALVGFGSMGLIVGALLVGLRGGR
jgi:hypothetical protein